MLVAFPAALHPPSGAVLRLYEGPAPERVADADADRLSARAERPAKQIVVTADVPRTEALKDWRDGAMLEGGALAFLTVMVSALGALLIRQLRRRDAVEVALRAAKDQADTANQAKSGILANMRPRNPHADERRVRHDRAALYNAHSADEQHNFCRSRPLNPARSYSPSSTISSTSRKLEANKVQLESVDFDLVNTVESSTSLVAGKAREKGIDLGSFVDPTARGAFRGDPMRIRQVLVNLLSNAVKFTDKGAVSVQVHLVRGSTDADQASRVRFEITDTGIGIPEAVCARLFQKFTQADSSITRRFGGTGLGLAISRQLVELIGGQIGVASRTGLGSTFWFKVPLAQSSAPVLDRSSLPAQLRNLRALVVDDIEMNLHGSSVVSLAPTAWKVATADDGFAALAELERAWHRGIPL